MKTIVVLLFVLRALSAAGKVFFTQPDQKVILVCGSPTFSNKLEWYHGDELLHSNVQRGLPFNGKSDLAERSRVREEIKLEIKPVKKEDGGVFICLVDGGRARHEHTLLVVSAWASPSVELQLGSAAELQCEVKGLNSGPTVQWKKPDGSPQSGSDTVQLGPVTRSDAGTWECLISHQGEEYSVNLVINIKEPHPVTTPPPAPPKDSDVVRTPTCQHCATQPPANVPLPLGLSWWIWAAAGVGFVVLVLLVVSIVVLYKRIKRRKRKLLMLKNGRRPLKTNDYCKCDRPAAAAKPQQGRRRERPSAPPLQPLLIQ